MKLFGREVQKRAIALGLIIIVIVLGGVAVLTDRKKTEQNYIQCEGFVFGTVYHVVYQYNRSLEVQIDSVLACFDASLSIFNESSILSRINRNDSTVELDAWSRRVFEVGKEVSQKSDGAFDMTVAPLVNAWGFGFKKKESITPELIKSILPYVGYTKIEVVNNRIVKQDPRIMIDASAIAKGYASDVVGEYLEKMGVRNYMVEIGGEIFCKGVNKLSQEWRVGVNRPIEDSLNLNQEVELVIPLTNKGLATSGNYRNFYYENGKRYAHTIDPHTGYPVQHELLSATVIAPSCIVADAYATSFMVMGLSAARKIVEEDPALEAYFIFSNEKGEMQTEHVK